MGLAFVRQMVQLDLIPIVNFVAWFAIYTVAAYAVVRIFHVNVRSREFVSGLTGLISTIIDAAANQSASGPVTGLSFFPSFSVIGNMPSPIPLPWYVVNFLIFLVVLVCIYLVLRG